MFSHFRYLFFALAIFMVLPFSASAIPSILEVSYKQQGSSEYLVIYSSEPIGERKLFALDNPKRLVLDVSRIANKTVELPKPPEDSAVRSLRFGHFSPVTSRFVMELQKKVKSRNVHSFKAKKGQPHRLVVELVGGTAFSEEVSLSKEQILAAIPMPEEKPFFARTQSYKPLVVIDAGHGGKDPGAIGKSKTFEKHITMDYASTLRKALLRTGDYNVAMTRDGDNYIFLDERVRMAREAGGDIFISIHADTAPEDHAKGLSVYTVSEEASDKEAALLAQTENAVDKIGGIKFADDNPDVADILIDLASRDTRIKSNELAALVVDNARKQSIGLLRNPNRFAGFRVLKAPDIPSILVEVGFLSNEHDEALLQQPSHRSKIVRSLVASIDAYFQKHPKDK